MSRAIDPDDSADEPGVIINGELKWSFNETKKFDREDKTEKQVNRALPTSVPALLTFINKFMKIRRQSYKMAEKRQSAAFPTRIGAFQANIPNSLRLAPHQQ